MSSANFEGGLCPKVLKNYFFHDKYSVPIGLYCILPFGIFDRNTFSSRRHARGHNASPSCPLVTSRQATNNRGVPFFQAKSCVRWLISITIHTSSPRFSIYIHRVLFNTIYVNLFTSLFTKNYSDVTSISYQTSRWFWILIEYWPPDEHVTVSRSRLLYNSVHRYVPVCLWTRSDLLKLISDLSITFIWLTNAVVCPRAINIAINFSSRLIQILDASFSIE